ncbi:MAG: RNA polymerase sigma factor [bacterium]|nr:RNA polymerase sigma factor [bacterium]
MHVLLLALQAKNGNRNSLEQLVKIYYEDIYRYIYRKVSNEQIAMDLTQETFLKLTKAFPQYKIEAKFTTFLYTIARNVVIDYYRWSSNRKEEGVVEEPSCSPYEEVDQKMYIESVLKQLPKEQVECIELYYYEGLKYNAIATILNLPVSTVKTRVRLGLKKCKVIMEGDEQYENVGCKERIAEA